MAKRAARFQAYRTRMNKRILAAQHLGINRFFNLDENAYRGGALDAKTKEIAGLVASMVLRCDDCIAYHVLRGRELGLTREQFFEAFNVALVVGGSIVIPHLRRAVELLDEVEPKAQQRKP
jgi:AhpD family alkylhydroperoxidase